MPKGFAIPLAGPDSDDIMRSYGCRSLSDLIPSG